MQQSNDRAVTLELRHTGERLALRRIKAGSCIEELHLTGSLPPHRDGPPLHIHFGEEEHGEVISGTLAASLDGKQFLVEAGGSARFPNGRAHRWWNGGDKELVLRGIATPAIDLDRYLQAMFEVLNAGPPGHPPL